MSTSGRNLGPDTAEQILALLDGLDGYHPSAVRRERRIQKEEEKLKAIEEAEREEEAEDSQTLQKVADRPDGAEGSIWDMEQFVLRSEAVYKQVLEEYKKVVEIASRGLDLNASDAERKPIAKEFMKALEDYSEFIREAKLDDHVLFDGSIKAAPVEFVVDNGKKESKLNVAFSSLLPDALGIAKCRLDNMMEARRSAPAFDKALDVFKRVEGYFQSKLDMLKLKRTQLSEYQLQQEALEKAQGEAFGAFGGAGGAQAIFDSLRRKQVKAARAKGRASALLLNIKV